MGGPTGASAPASLNTEVGAHARHPGFSMNSLCPRWTGSFPKRCSLDVCHRKRKGHSRLNGPHAEFWSHQKLAPTSLAPHGRTRTSDLPLAIQEHPGLRKHKIPDPRRGIQSVQHAGFANPNCAIGTPPSVMGGTAAIQGNFGTVTKHPKQQPANPVGRTVHVLTTSASARA